MRGREDERQELKLIPYQHVGKTSILGDRYIHHYLGILLVMLFVSGHILSWLWVEVKSDMTRGQYKTRYLVFHHFGISTRSAMQFCISPTTRQVKPTTHLKEVLSGDGHTSSEQQAS